MEEVFIERGQVRRWRVNFEMVFLEENDYLNFLISS